MKQIRKKIFVNGRYRILTLYEVRCKWGTQNVLYAYLFDDPQVGLITKAIRDTDENFAHSKQYRVRITDMVDGIVYLELM